MADLTVNIEGLAEIQRKLKLLPDRIGKNAMRRALRKGANVIRDAARANAKLIDDPETREMIWKNIAVAGGGRRREKQAGGPMMRVGVRGGARPTRGDNGTPGGNTTHWRFVHFGVPSMDIPARPFLSKAGAEKAQAAYDAIAADAIKQVDKELSKLG